MRLEVEVVAASRAARARCSAGQCRAAAPLARRAAAKAAPVRLTLLSLLVVGLMATTPASGDEVATRVVRRHPAVHLSLDERVDRLSLSLGLDSGQRAELRQILERQRTRLAQLWGGEQTPAAYRGRASQLLDEQVADQIRAMLNEEQRKQYKPPRAAREELARSGQSAAADWLDGERAKPLRVLQPAPANDGLPPR